MSNFSKLQGKIEAKGEPPEAARKITAAIGIAKLGKKVMAERSAAARKKGK